MTDTEKNQLLTLLKKLIDERGSIPLANPEVIYCVGDAAWELVLYLED